MNDLESIGIKIKELRKKRGYSQEKLAEIVDVNFRTIQRIETGKNIPTLETLVKLAQALEVTMKDLFTYECFKSRDELLKKINLLINKLDDEKLKTFYKIASNLYN